MAPTLTPAVRKFVLHWGEMGARWGVNRSVAQIHALLSLAERPLPADEIVETLSALRERRRLTVVLVEQNLDFIAALSERVLIIQKGVITREVTPAELSNPDLVGEFVGIAG